MSIIYGSAGEQQLVVSVVTHSLVWTDMQAPDGPGYPSVGE
jgi:hypothetical protein